MRCLISKVLKSEGIYKGFTFQPLAMYRSPQMSIGQAQQGGLASPIWLFYQTGIYILDLVFVFRDKYQGQIWWKKQQRNLLGFTSRPVTARGGTSSFTASSSPSSFSTTITWKGPPFQATHQPCFHQQGSHFHTMWCHISIEAITSSPSLKSPQP